MPDYTKQDYERDLQIVADAPCNSTHYVKRVNRVLYYKLHRSILYSWNKINRDWSYISYMGRASNSLQDIRDKIAMYEANQKLIAQIHTDKIMTQIRHNQKEHDKQVKIDAVVHFCAWLVDNGEPIAEEELQVIGSKYINQIKGK